MRTAIFVLVLIFLAGASALAQNKVEAILESEIEATKRLFFEVVGQSVNPEEEYLRFVVADMAKIIEREKWTESQYCVYVDRNPSRQMIFVFLFDWFIKRVNFIGADRISTGNPKPKGHFLTPTGVFENTVQNFGYRALGTKNNRGWRGLGEKGARVWDFGWQKTDYKKEKRDIRLLLHATDPVYGEKRLGTIDSKGCIRISGKLNKFLDYYGILDKDYYENNKSLKAISWLLRPNFQPIAFAGKYLLVSDSFLK